MEYVTLQEGSQITGKSEMTIRRLTKKPGGKTNAKMEDGKLYIAREYLLKHYPPIQPIQEQQAAVQSPADVPTQTPIQTAPEPVADPAYAVDYTSLLQAKDKTIELLDGQLKVVNTLLDQERQQAAQDRNQHNEQTINFQKLLNNKERALQEAMDKINLLPMATQGQPGEVPAEKNKEQWWLYGFVIVMALALVAVMLIK